MQQQHISSVTRMRVSPHGLAGLPPSPALHPGYAVACQQQQQHAQAWSEAWSEAPLPQLHLPPPRPPRHYYSLAGLQVLQPLGGALRARRGQQQAVALVDGAHDLKRGHAAGAAAGHGGARQDQPLL